MNTSIYLRSFRLVCNPNCISLVENLLEQQGFRFIPEHFSPFVRRLVHEPFPLGASFAAKFGYIYIQDKSFEGISLKITIEEVSNPFGNNCLLNKTLYSKDDSKILQVLPKEIIQEYEASLKRKFIDFKMLKKSA